MRTRMFFILIISSLPAWGSDSHPNEETRFSLDDSIARLSLKNMIAVRHGTPSEKQILPIRTKEIYYQRRLNRISGTLLTPAMELSVSELNVDGEKGYVYGLGPAFSIPVGGSDGQLNFSAHAKVHYLSRYNYGIKRYGGPVHWTYAIGLKTSLSINTFASYMWQHMSNGDVYERNPALETHTVTMGIYF